MVEAGGIAGQAVMDARLERKLRRLAGVVVAGAVAGIAFTLAQGHESARTLAAGISYGVSISASLGVIEYFVLKARCKCGSAAFRSRPA
jgi:uncharacterized membrane protein YccC